MKPVSLKIIDRVAWLLETSESSRNDYSKLIANYWYHELIDKGYTEESAKGFCKIIAEDILTNTESIRRCRQKLQEKDPEKYGFNKARNEKKNQIKNQIKEA